jgi:hypothetical protein
MKEAIVVYLKVCFPNSPGERLNKTRKMSEGYSVPAPDSKWELPE